MDILKEESSDSESSSGSSSDSDSASTSTSGSIGRSNLAMSGTAPQGNLPTVASAPAQVPASILPMGQSSSSDAGRKRKADYSKEKSKQRRTEMEQAICLLAEQVSDIKNYLCDGTAFRPPYYSTSVHTPNYYGDDATPEISVNVSGELYREDQTPASNAVSDPPKQSIFFDLPINTVLKEPSIPKSSSKHLELLNNIQHFNTDQWDSVRYAEVQKQYCSTPGFTYLDTNDELKPYDKYISVALTERGFAAITQAVIKQNEAAQSGFKEVIEWASSVGPVSADSLQQKIQEVFVKGSFQKISGDILQLSCGHRAEMIQQRRDSLLRSIKDNFLKASLRKIPPTCDNLFHKDLFTSAIEKAGGVAKISWPLRAPTHFKTAAQAQSQQQTQALPSYATNFPNKSHNFPAYTLPDLTNRFTCTFFKCKQCISISRARLPSSPRTKIRDPASKVFASETYPTIPK